MSDKIPYIDKLFQKTKWSNNWRKNNSLSNYGMQFVSIAYGLLIFIAAYPMHSFLISLYEGLAPLYLSTILILNKRDR